MLQNRFRDLPSEQSRAQKSEDTKCMTINMTQLWLELEVQASVLRLVWWGMV
jgi:hypothetical protein